MTDTAFARVQSNAASDPGRRQGFGDRHRALDCARRAIERRQEPIPGGVHFMAAKSCKFVADLCIMRL